MTFVSGTSVAVLANEKVVTATVSGASVQHSRAYGEATTFADGGARYVPGLMSGSIKLMGPQDSVGQNLYGEVSAAVGVDNGLQIIVCPEGTAIGKPALFAIGDVTDWAVDANVKDAVAASLTCQSDESTALGFIVHALAAETVTGNGTAVDRGTVSTPSTHGADVAISCTAYSGLTSAAIKIQHSTDNSTWADLVSFTTLTAIGNERKVVADGTTVNRYVRVVTTVAGTGSATFLVAMAPR
jgi:hypothetical protein